MPRYEPYQRSQPHLKEGMSLKMRRNADGTWKPVGEVTRTGEAPDAADATPAEGVLGQDAERQAGEGDAKGDGA